MDEWLGAGVVCRVEGVTFAARTGYEDCPVVGGEAEASSVFGFGEGPAGVGAEVDFEGFWWGE